jgi:hypothetical protein
LRRSVTTRRAEMFTTAGAARCTAADNCRRLRARRRYRGQRFGATLSGRAGAAVGALATDSALATTTPWQQLHAAPPRRRRAPCRSRRR